VKLILPSQDIDIIQLLPACEANIEVVNPRIVEIREI
jgi:hypothetical protein